MRGLHVYNVHFISDAFNVLIDHQIISYIFQTVAKMLLLLKKNVHVLRKESWVKRERPVSKEIFLYAC